MTSIWVWRRSATISGKNWRKSGHRPGHVTLSRRLEEQKARTRQLEEELETIKGKPSNLSSAVLTF